MSPAPATESAVRLEMPDLTSVPPAKNSGRVSPSFEGFSLNPLKVTVMTTKGRMAVIPHVIMANIKPSLMVAVVSVSLSIGLGIASGSTPIAGLRTAAWAGITSGLFGASAFNILGPAGALSGMLSDYSADWTPDILPWIAILSGLMCGITLALGLHKYMLFMPKSVFEGFTIAVAIIIGLKQINYACGLVTPHVTLEKHDNFVLNVIESVSNIHQTNWQSLVLFAPETIALYVLMRYVPKIPWMVVIPCLTIIVGWVADTYTAWDLPNLKTQFGELDNRIIELPKWEALRDCNHVKFVLASAAVCVVSVLETLISAKIADFRAPDNQRGSFNEGREVLSLTGAQLLCGLFGGMPPTGVFVRTSVNQINGATHMLSQFMNAVVVLIITVAAMPIFGYLPLASIAAVLAISAIRMIPYAFLKELWKYDKVHLGVCLFTTALCVGLDPVEGLMYGTLVSFLIASMKASTNDIALMTSIHSSEGGHSYHVMFNGPITYANADATYSRGIQGLSDKDEDVHITSVIFDLTHVTDVDSDGIGALSRLTTTVQSMTKAEEGIELCMPRHPVLFLNCHPWLSQAIEKGNMYVKSDSEGGDDAEEHNPRTPILSPSANGRSRESSKKAFGVDSQCLSPSARSQNLDDGTQVKNYSLIIPSSAMPEERPASELGPYPLSPTYDGRHGHHHHA